MVAGLCPRRRALEKSNCRAPDLDGRSVQRIAALLSDGRRLQAPEKSAESAVEAHGA